MQGMATRQLDSIRFPAKSGMCVRGELRSECMSLLACLQPVASLSAKQFAIRAKIYFSLTTLSAVCQSALFRARGLWVLLMGEGWPLSLAGSVRVSTSSESIIRAVNAKRLDPGGVIHSFACCASLPFARRAWLSTSNSSLLSYMSDAATHPLTEMQHRRPVRFSSSAHVRHGRRCPARLHPHGPL